MNGDLKTVLDEISKIRSGAECVKGIRIEGKVEITAGSVNYKEGMTLQDKIDYQMKSGWAKEYEYPADPITGEGASNLLFYVTGRREFNQPGKQTVKPILDKTATTEKMEQYKKDVGVPDKDAIFERDGQIIKATAE